MVRTTEVPVRAMLAFTFTAFPAVRHRRRLIRLVKYSLLTGNDSRRL